MAFPYGDDERGRASRRGKHEPREGRRLGSEPGLPYDAAQAVVDQFRWPYIRPTRTAPKAGDLDIRSPSNDRYRIFPAVITRLRKRSSVPCPRGVTQTRRVGGRPTSSLAARLRSIGRLVVRQIAGENKQHKLRSAAGASARRSPGDATANERHSAIQVGKHLPTSTSKTASPDAAIPASATTTGSPITTLTTNGGGRRGQRLGEDRQRPSAFARALGRPSALEEQQTLYVPGHSAARPRPATHRCRRCSPDAPAASTSCAPTPRPLVDRDRDRFQHIIVDQREAHEQGARSFWATMTASVAFLRFAINSSVAAFSAEASATFNVTRRCPGPSCPTEKARNQRAHLGAPSRPSRRRS